MIAHPPGLTTGDVLRIERKRLGLSLRRAARDSDVSPSFLSEIERNRQAASEDVIIRLAALLHLDPWELCLRDGRAPEALTRWLRTHSTDAAPWLRAMMDGAP